MAYKDPEKRRLAGTESARRRRARERQERAAAGFSVEPRLQAVDPVAPAALGPLLPESVRLRDMADVVALLETAARCIARDPGAAPIEKGRAFAQVANAALRAVDAADVAARLAAVEAIVSPRRSRSV